MFPKLCVALAFALALTTAPAQAGPLEDGAAAYKTGKYDEAARLFRLAAG
jgi:hypothetical protein